jgi:hypothetical protein
MEDILKVSKAMVSKSRFGIQNQSNCDFNSNNEAAGHGNIFNETYTAYFGRDVRRIWEAIGIEFEDRNYAMGGMR